MIIHEKESLERPVRETAREFGLRPTNAIDVRHAVSKIERSIENDTLKRRQRIEIIAAIMRKLESETDGAKLDVARLVACVLIQPQIFRPDQIVSALASRPKSMADADHVEKIVADIIGLAVLPEVICKLSETWIEGYYCTGCRLSCNILYHEGDDEVLSSCCHEPVSIRAKLSDEDMIEVDEDMCLTPLDMEPED